MRPTFPDSITWVKASHLLYACSLVILLSCGVFFSNAAPAEAPPDQRPEYEIKAAMLYKLSLFIQWPTNSFPARTTPFIIGVLGEDPFGVELDKLARIEKVHNREIRIQRVEKGGAPPPCHILFISNSERRRLEEILKTIHGKPILTVGEMDPFCSRGGGIRFLSENKKIKLRINPDATMQAGLRVRSDLLSIAKIVRTEGQ